MNILTAAEAAERTRRYQALYRRATRYEVVAELVGGRRFLLGYARSPSKSDLMNLAKATGADFGTLTGLVESDPCTYSRAAGWTFGAGKLRVRRSGRTERDAIIEGELPLLSAEVAS